MDLSVIIVNYNVRQFLENALTSIQRALAGLEGEIFIVDNASDDGSAEMVRTKFPGVTLIENRENIGFARANNIALREARGRFLLLINPDTIVQEDTFAVMLKFFEEHPEAGLAGCKILNPDGTFQLPCRRSYPTPWVAFTKIFGLSALFPKSKLFGRYNLTYLSPDETYPVEAVSGSFMMMRKAVYDAIGGLDEAFFMYGEDLDWCYRVLQAGYKVFYVHNTKIIHFKGESTRRSDIDELKHFYQAMQLFVEKHFRGSGIIRLFLQLGILLRGGAASFARAGRPLMVALVDFLLVDLALFLSAFIYFGNPYHFTLSAHPVVWFVPALIVVLTSSISGVYTGHRYSFWRAGLSVIVGYVLISALVYFAKDFAYSRFVVIVSGLLTFVFLPGWRLLARLFGKARREPGSRKILFGNRTVIVGTGPSALEVLRKLRARVDNGYDVQGFIDLTRRNVGEKIAGVEILGSIDNVGKVIAEKGITEVIFSTDGLSYGDILTVIGRSNTRGVNFRLVPNSLEAIIGKTSIDELDTLPLVEIEYNIQKTVNRFTKRAFDLAGSAFLLPVLYIPLKVAFLLGWRPAPDSFAGKMLLLPSVFTGRLSFVGLPIGRKSRPGVSVLGPEGLTGLVQLNAREGVEPEEIERYELYYAKNQSLALDLEILLKTLLR
jgi:GT2 family glycosyltransferase